MERSISEIAEDATHAMVENDAERMLEIALELEAMGRHDSVDGVLWHAAFVEERR